MNFVFLILLASVKTAIARKCYTCTADSDEACDDKQKVVPCTSDEQCVMLKYTTGFGKKRVHKFCQEKKFDCDEECFGPMATGHKGCKASCCDEDYCNIQTIEKKAIGSKRSLSDNVSNSSTSTKGPFLDISVLLLFQLATWIFAIQL